MKILTVCTTYNRPKLCERMLKSFLATKSECTDIFFTLDEEDPSYCEYKRTFSNYGVNFMSIPLATVTDHINTVWRAFQDYDYYHITNDDVEYKTSQWDAALITAKSGIFYGDDLLQGINLPTFPIISSDICSALGFLQCPSVDKYFGDTIWKYIGKGANCLYYNPNVIIEHHHNLNGKREQDNPIYENQYKKDEESFANWLLTNRFKDIRRVQGCLIS